jgi:(1->4)-alpha-D-glucan 1-alpha-D-glucosylmutase
VLISQCEVGSDPGDDARDAVERLHAAATEAATESRHGLVATATHDTKRGEDTRARIAAVSEDATSFEAALSAWRAVEANRARGVAADEWRFVAQTLLGAWPLDDSASTRADLATRLAQYLRKALREAKLRTSWLDADERHEAEVVDLATRAVAPDSLFADAFDVLRSRVAVAGAVNGLSQLLMKIALPGIPDIYRGCEGWDLSLVDPDNRRPVDHAQLSALLAEHGPEPDWADLRSCWPNGAIKVLLTARLLTARRDHDALFARGAYVGVAAGGRRAAHAVAARREMPDASDIAIAVATRLPMQLAPGAWPIGDVWSDTSIDVGRGSWRDAVTDRSLDGNGALLLRDVLCELPIALLLRT